MAGKRTVGNINVILSASTARFQRGMKRASAAVGKFSKSAVRVGFRLAKMGAAFAAAGVAIAAYYTAKAFKSIDATAKLARSIGIATEKLAGLRLAAQLSGVSSEAFDKSIKQLVRRVGELNFKTGEAEYALTRLGLDGAKLAEMSPDEAIRAIAERLAGVKLASERAALAYTLFGRAGIDLVNLLSMTGAQMDEVQQQAVKLGLAFSNIDAAKVEAANDALTRVKSVFEGIWNAVAINLAPLITDVSDRIWTWATSGEGVGVVVTKVMAAIGRAVGKVVEWVYDLQAAFVEMKMTALLTLAELQENDPVAQSFQWHRDSAAGLRAAAEEMADEVTKLRNAGWKAGKGVEEYIAGVQRAADKAAEAAVKWKENTAQIPDAIAEAVAAVVPEKIERATGGNSVMGSRAALVRGTAEEFRARQAGGNPVVSAIKEVVKEVKRSNGILGSLGKDKYTYWAF